MDLIWTYSAYDISSGTSVKLPNFITHSNTKFYVYTSDHSNIGVYKIEITATLPTLQSSTMTFILNVEDACSTSVFSIKSSPSHNPYEYDI